jgi:enoyl-CoA hydratase/carnithine racemase
MNDHCHIITAPLLYNAALPGTIAEVCQNMSSPAATALHRLTIDTRGVARLTLCNSGALNIVGTPAITALTTALDGLAARPGLRAVVFACESERAFIGGADIREMAQLDPATAETFISTLAGLCEAVRRCPVPVIARIPGWCLGGGLEVAAACDLRLASPEARFGMPEVKVGIPSVIHAALLPRLIGMGRARWLVMTGAVVDASTALGWGLVDALAGDDGLDALVERVLADLLACGPAALRAQKELCRQWEELPLSAAIGNSVGIFGAAFRSGEPQAAMQAFLDRKKS